MQGINIDEITSDLETKEIKVIPVGYNELKSIQLKGDLDSFVTTVKALNESVVFMQSFSFDEDDFLHEIKKPILGEYSDPPKDNEINTKQFLPELAEYENYFEQTSLLIFRVFYKNQVFAYWHKAEWFVAFTKLFEEAQKIFEEKENAIREQQEQQKNAARETADQRETYLRGLLEELATDDKFIGLKTQKSKQEYAIARYPELSELSMHILKDDISTLNARIEARKMLQ